MLGPIKKTDEYREALHNLVDICKTLAQKYQLTAASSTIEIYDAMGPPWEGPVIFRDSKQRLVATISAVSHFDQDNFAVTGIDSVTLLTYQHLENKEQFSQDFLGAYTGQDFEKDVIMQYVAEKPL